MTSDDRRVAGERRVGLPGVDTVLHGVHLCHVYTSLERAAAVYVPFIKEGLEARERCIVVADGVAARTIHAALNAAIPRLGEHLDEGQVAVVSPQSWFSTGAAGDGHPVWRSAIAAAETQGFTGVRAYAVVPAAGGTGAAFRADYEQQMHIAACAHLLVVCAYAAGSLTFADLAVIGAGHHYVVVESGSGIRVTANVPWLHVSDQLSQVARRYRQIFENSEEAILVAQDGMIRLHNPKLERILGYSAEDIRTMPFVTFIHPDDRDRVLDRHRRRLRGESVETRYSFRAVAKDGSVHHVDITTTVMEWEGRPAVLCFLTDVTERERAKTDLVRSEARYRELWDNAPVAYHVLDLNGVIRDVNRTECALLGYERSEMVGRPIFDFVAPEQRDEARTRFLKKIAGEQLEPSSQREYLRKDGSRVAVAIEDVLERDASGTVTGVRTTMMDVTEQRRMLAELNRSREQYRDLWENSRVGMFRTVLESGRILAANRELLRLFGVQSLEGVTTPSSYLRPRDRERFVTVLQARGEVEGFETELRRPDGTTFWASISARLRSADGVIEGVMLDITARKRMEAQLQESASRARRTLEHTVIAIARIVEMRDPYTAGHQRRVASLAQALAREMQWEPSRVSGVLIAGFLHDVGKVMVPVEILVKPGRISEYEFNIIKSHPRAGYDILTEIEFDWPVADIVLQHHERLDGSGYPEGIRGEALLPEARILSVADVVEAMASHRPYRPSLGIDRALEEIESNRGRLYDEVVVDACLRLFRERRFTFSDSEHA